MSLSIKPQDKKLLKEICSFAVYKKKKLYLVGGYLRDIFLKREKANPDMDFCLRGNSINFARALAKKLSCGFVILDKERGCCRLVRKAGEKIYTLDFTDFRKDSLEDDLLHRDFTINALALDVGGVSSGLDTIKGLIDPCQAITDLKTKTIRAINKKTFDDDPLRILRAFSLSAIFGFKIEKETLKLIRLKKNKLARVSRERVRDELFKILDTADSFKYLSQMDDLNVLRTILPEIEVMRNVKQGPYHHLDVFNHSLETLRQIEILIEKLKKSKEIRDYLAQDLSAGRKRRSLIKLAAFLHDIGKPKTLRRVDGKTKFYGHEQAGAKIAYVLAKRLKLSNEEFSVLGKMVFWHLRPGYLADNETVTRRASFRYFRDTKNEAVSTLLLSLADQRSTRGPLTTKASRQRHEKVCRSLIKDYFRKRKEKKQRRLIDGFDLMKELRLSPSPLVGRLLAEVEELQAIGKVKTKREALAAAKKMV